MSTSRRDVLKAALAGAAAALVPSCSSSRDEARREPASARPFKLSVFTDEISQDFEAALAISADEFGLEHVEVRGLWNKNIVALDADEVARARRLLEQHHLRVSSIAGPLFKVDWPGAPTSRFSPKDSQFAARFTFADQERVLERCLELAHELGTDRVRCFDFWRLDDCAPYRAAMDAKLIEAADRAGERGLTLVMENEHECNTASLTETLRTLAAVDRPSFKLNFDPGNAAFAGAVAFPDFYERLPKDRIGHVHCKDVVRGADGAYEWAAMGRGIIDYEGLFRALARDGYRGAVVLETHWRGGGSPEESTRQSMAGLKALLARAGVLS